MTYEEGFDAGERQSYEDRQTQHFRQRPEVIHSPWTRGFWDGYTPRRVLWQMQQPRTFRQLEAA
jgi:hypothetical protein